MGKELRSKSVGDFLAILPVSAALSDTIVCADTKKGENFFEEFKGAEIVGISFLRYVGFDVAAFITSDGRAIAVVGKPDSFIALEKSRGIKNEGKELALGFRKDISHKRWNSVLSAAAGQDVTYQDDSLAPRERVEVDPTSEFVQLVFDKGKKQTSFKIDSVRPTWYTEDWFTLMKSNFESLTLRADRSSILGAFAISGSKIRPLQFGEGDNINRLKINQPPKGIIPSRILPQKPRSSS